MLGPVSLARLIIGEAAHARLVVDAFLWGHQVPAPRIPLVGPPRTSREKTVPSRMTVIKKAERTFFFEPFVRSVIGNARSASFFVALKLTVAGFFSLVLFSICFSHPATAFLFYGLSKQRKRSLMSECCESPWQGMCKKPRCEKRNNGDRGHAKGDSATRSVADAANGRFPNTEAENKRGGH